MQTKQETVSKPKILTREEVEKILSLNDSKIKELQDEQEKIKQKVFKRLSKEEEIINRNILMIEHYKISENNEGLAESLFNIGDFDSAIKITQDEDRREFYQKIKTASEASECKCDKFSDINGDLIPNKFLYLETVKDKKLLRIFRCNVCGELFNEARASI